MKFSLKHFLNAVAGLWDMAPRTNGRAKLSLTSALHRLGKRSDAYMLHRDMYAIGNDIKNAFARYSSAR